jgi:hypothetical protein
MDRDGWGRSENRDQEEDEWSPVLRFANILIDDLRDALEAVDVVESNPSQQSVSTIVKGDRPSLCTTAFPQF